MLCALCVLWRLIAFQSRPTGLSAGPRAHAQGPKGDLLPLDTAFLDLAFQCAPAAQVETLAAVAKVESGFKPLSILVDGKPLASQDLGEAVSRAVEELQAGKLVRLGLMGLSAQQAVSHGGSLLTAFDGCKSVTLAGKSLSAAQVAQLRDGRQGDDEQPAVLEAFYRDGGGDFDAARKFAGQVAAARTAEAKAFAALMAARSAKPWVAEVASAATATPPPAANPAWRVYGSDVRAGVLVFSKQEKDKQ